MTEWAIKREKEKNEQQVNAVPEMGFPTSGNGTITGNVSASSSTGNLSVMVLTYTLSAFAMQISIPITMFHVHGFSFASFMQAVCIIHDDEWCFEDVSC